ncbi:MAG: CHAT domain-containing protein [Anaerolineae bacterium]|nr:CHAT domain-containing protein [Anaerolineae bacterium]
MEQLTFHDFEIDISANSVLPGNGGYFSVAVLHSPSGQARATMRLPFDVSAMDAQLAAIESALANDVGQVARQFGTQLFDTLIRGDVRTVYDLSRQAVLARGEGLRIKLRINAPELIALPWEFLYDPRQAEFVALSRHTPLVRYVELPIPESVLSVRPPLRILGMVAAPSDVGQLDVEREKTRLEQAMGALQAQGQVELHWVEGQTWRDLQTAMQQGPWHVFHFVGHAFPGTGGSEGALLLADEDGFSAPLGASQLALLLSDHHTLRLVLLNACEGARAQEQSQFSSLAAALVQRGLPAVLAMQYPISDAAAVEFTASFYGALAANLPIDASVSEARKALSLAQPQSIEWGTPVLSMRAPDGVLWRVETPPEEQAIARIRKLSWPIVLTPLLVLIAIGILAYPLLKPLWAPAQMTGQFRIAVADFGEIDARDRVRRSQTGSLLSRWLFESLYEEYQQNADIELAQSVEIWHDSRKDTEQNIRFGVMRGDTFQERQAAAATLADRVNAHMVIYGHLVDGGATQRLEIEFYISPLLNDETASLVGPYRLGKPIPLPVPFDVDSPEVGILVDEKLQVRTQALFWLTMGLTTSSLGRSEQALEILLHAEQALDNWPEDDGKELLYFFIGREQLSLKQSEKAQAAFRRALDIDPAYARAQVGLGSTYLQRARAVPPQERLDAPHDLEQALENHRLGLDLARQAAEPLGLAAAYIASAKSHRLLGETYYLFDRLQEARQSFDRVLEETEQAIALLNDTRQYRLLAQAYESRGAAFLQSGAILRQQAQTDASRIQFELAKAAYQSCLEQGIKAPFDAFLQTVVIEQGCQRYYAVAEENAQK